jgi:hypothetical protein
MVRLSVSLIVVIVLFGCGGNGTGSPTSPTSPSSPKSVSVQALTVAPEGAGLIFQTNFSFQAVGTFPTGAQFTWQFGDGSSTVTDTPTATHVYQRTGEFGVIVEARAGGNTAASTRQVSVRSLVGRWSGTVTGHTHVPRGRPIPITAFDLTINSAPAPVQGRPLLVDAFWADNAGCRVRGIYQNIPVQSAVIVSLGIESFDCNDLTDFYFGGSADAALNRVEGTCGMGGPNCRFQMTRQ